MYVRMTTPLYTTAAAGTRTALLNLNLDINRLINQTTQLNPSPHHHLPGPSHPCQNGQILASSLQHT
jgi:hypothetical protein